MFFDEVFTPFTESQNGHRDRYFFSFSAPLAECTFSSHDYPVTFDSLHASSPRWILPIRIDGPSKFLCIPLAGWLPGYDGSSSRRTILIRSSASIPYSSWQDKA